MISGTSQRTHAPPASVLDIVSDVRRGIYTEKLVPVSTCVDTLLDCYTATKSLDVKSLIGDVLVEFSTGHIRLVEDFLDALDRVAVAEQLQGSKSTNIL